MKDPLHRAKQPVSPALAGPYGHPFHPILVTVPIGAWVASLIFDIASELTQPPGPFTQGSTWLIAIGVVGAFAAASIGFLDLLAIQTGTKAFRTAVLHMTLNLVVTGAYLANFLWRRTYDEAAGVAVGPIALSIVSLAALAVSGFLGGKLAFHYGVRVAAETTQAEGYADAKSPAATRPPPETR